MSQYDKLPPSYRFDPKNSIVPATSSGFYDADLLHDIMVLSKIPLRVQNIPAIRALVRLIKGKVVARITSLKALSDVSKYPVDKPLLDKLYELKASFENQEKAVNNFARGMLARQAMLHKMMMVATKKRMAAMYQKTKDRYDGMRRQLSSANMRKYVLAQIIKKKLEESQ